MFILVTEYLVEPNFSDAPAEPSDLSSHCSVRVLACACHCLWVLVLNDI